MSNVVISDGITPELNRIAEQLRRPRQLTAACGKRMERDLRAHFLARDKEGNARGWPSRHFWNRTVRANTGLTEVSDSRAVVSIASPEFAQKVFGGRITPKRAKALAIPANAEAYRAGSPREANVDQLDFVPMKLRGGRLIGMLVRRMQSIAKGRDRGKQIGGDIWYYLYRSVTQRPDPRAWPALETLQDGILEEARKALARVLRIRGE